MENVVIRFAEKKDLEKIWELYEATLEPCSNKAEREFLREKIRLHIIHPSSHILTAWVGEDLASFIIYVSDEEAFTKYLKSPKVLIRNLLRLLLGFYGFNLLQIIRLLNRFTHRTDRTYRSARTTEGECANRSNAYLGGIATAISYRGKGIAKNLMLQAMEHLRKLGVKEFTSLVHHTNEASLSMHLKLGFEQKAIIRYLDGHVYLLQKDLGGGNNNSARGTQERCSTR